MRTDNYRTGLPGKDREEIFVNRLANLEGRTVPQNRDLTQIYVRNQHIQTREAEGPIGLSTELLNELKWEKHIWRWKWWKWRAHVWKQ